MSPPGGDMGKIALRFVTWVSQLTEVTEAVLLSSPVPAHTPLQFSSHWQTKSNKTNRFNPLPNQ